MHISNLDYVGSDASGDENLSILAVCRQIQSLKQQNHAKDCTTFLSPEILSNQFSSLATNQLDNARTWTLQLFSTFLAALSTELSDAIRDDREFKIPDITTLDTKSKQLAALRTVHDSAVTYWKEKRKRDELILRHVNSINGTSKSTGKGNLQYATTASTNNQHNPLLYQHSLLLAETTLQK